MKRSDAQVGIENGDFEFDDLDGDYKYTNVSGWSTLASAFWWSRV